MTPAPFTPTQKKISSIIPLTTIFLVAVIVRIILFLQDSVIVADGIGYIEIARRIFQKFDFSTANHFPPLFPFLIGIFSFFSPNDEVAGKVVSTVMGSLLIFPLYFLGKETFSRKTGFVAAILAALSPTLVSISGIVLSQSTYITLLITALLLCWRLYTKNSCVLAMAAGAMFAFSYLTRPEAVIVFAGISALFLLLRPSTLSMKDTLKLLLFSWAAFFLLAFPYILLLHKINGTWQLTGKSGVTLADSLGWYLQRPDLKREPGFVGLNYMEVIRQYPDFLRKNMARNIPAAMAELQPQVWVLTVLGLISAYFSPERWRRLLFGGAALLPLGVIIVFFWIDSHYFSPYIPILFIFAGEGIVTLAKGLTWVFQRIGQTKLAGFANLETVFALILAVFAIGPILMVDRNSPYDPKQDGGRYDHKLIGLKLKKYLPANSRVMTKSSRIAFYGDFHQVDIPQATLTEIIKAAKDGKASYLIVDGALPGVRPQITPYIAPLLIPQERFFSTEFSQLPDFSGGLRLVLLYKDTASCGVAVYKFPE